MDTETRYVLLVDDEANILNSLRRELRNWSTQKGLAILTAESAQSALEILKEQAAATVIVVSDLRMPEMKGSDFLLAVHAAYPEIITILLTGYSETEEIAKAVKAGIFSFIMKPWQTEYLISEMTKALEYGELRSQNARNLKIMEEELRWAGELQKALLKPSLPYSKRVEFRVSYQPVPGLFCGGDYYDVIPLSSERYLVFIGDVAGHGVQAAIVTAILKAVIFPEYLGNDTVRDFSPGTFLSWLNNRMNFELRQTTGLMITFFAGILDFRTGMLHYANAGQPHPFLLRQGTAIELPAAGPGLGVTSSVMYVVQKIAVQSGDVLTLYTDGLIEVKSGNKYALTPSAKIFGSVPYAADYHRQLLSTALNEAQAKQFSDDVTLLTARML